MCITNYVQDSIDVRRHLGVAPPDLEARALRSGFARPLFHSNLSRIPKAWGKDNRHVVTIPNKKVDLSYLRVKMLCLFQISSKSVSEWMNEWMNGWIIYFRAMKTHMNKNLSVKFDPKAKVNK